VVAATRTNETDMRPNSMLDSPFAPSVICDAGIFQQDGSRLSNSRKQPFHRREWNQGRKVPTQCVQQICDRREEFSNHVPPPANIGFLPIDGFSAEII
jgi:hypothetical protein